MSDFWAFFPILTNFSNDDFSKGPNFHYYACVHSDRYVYLFYEKYRLYMVEIVAKRGIMKSLGRNIPQNLSFLVNFKSGYSWEIVIISQLLP